MMTVDDAVVDAVEVGQRKYPLQVAGVLGGDVGGRFLDRER